MKGPRSFMMLFKVRNVYVARRPPTVGCSVMIDVGGGGGVGASRCDEADRLREFMRSHNIVRCGQSNDEGLHRWEGSGPIGRTCT